MFWLKSCPKCTNGDLYESRDSFGSYVACLQCGYYLTQAEEVVLRYVSRLARQSAAAGGHQGGSEKVSHTAPALGTSGASA
ncbi:MAG: hypothetical protein FJ316_00875 [SAR202 cluster bacterium]|nr:hypothetical protein [SAR202 cluster bacterium]